MQNFVFEVWQRVGIYSNLFYLELVNDCMRWPKFCPFMSRAETTRADSAFFLPCLNDFQFRQDGHHACLYNGRVYKERVYISCTFKEIKLS